ncbi:hypothetical protein [Effusibacillus consociatus]|uniref:Uncharacterized protein n=1 Tax=Effusibacillus consociatus TaxID=1117041 RepID=A0ABV9Q498_9BACL
MEYRRPQSYEERFLAVSTKLERLFFRVAMLGFAGIVISQFVLSVPELRQVLSVTDGMEGQKISQDGDSQASMSVTAHEIIIRPVKGQSGPIEAWVKINGIPIVRIGESETAIKVKHGDRIEIDTSSKNGIYQFEIDHNDPSVTSPTPGTVVESSEGHAAVVEQVLISSNSLAR